jgi:hypothetical protein
MRTVSLALAVTTVLSSPARAQKPPLIGGRVAGEIAAGALAMPVGIALGSMAGEKFSHDAPPIGAFLGAVAGAIAAPVLAVHAVAGPTRANYASTTVGTSAGYAVGYTLLTSNVIARIPNAGLRAVAGTVTVLLPAIGATIGYNATRR